MNNAAKSITAIVEEHQLEEAGAIVYFNFAGPTDRDRLAKEWEAAGFDTDEIPEFTSFRRALTRACEDVCSANGYVKLKRPRGWEIVEPDKDAEVGDSAGTVQAMVEMSIVQTPAVTPDTWEHEKQLIDAYYRHLWTVTNRDMSVWVIKKLLRKVDAVTLRPHGGVYFVPRPKLELWRKMAACIKASGSNYFYAIPAVHGDEATEAVMDALMNETVKRIANVDAVLEDEEHTSRQLATQGERLAQLVDKLATYESVVGERLDKLREKIGEAQATTAQAILVSSMKEDTEG